MMCSLQNNVRVYRRRMVFGQGSRLKPRQLSNARTFKRRLQNLKT